MPDFRIVTGSPGDSEELDSHSLIEALIHSSDDVAKRFAQMASNLPYRSFQDQLLDGDISKLTQELAAATWKRVSDEVPSYGFAEKVGRRYSEAGLPVGALLIHWQILRRSVHLTLAEKHFRTGRGSEDVLRQSSIMDYTLDWAAEASLVGYVLNPGGVTEPAG